MATGDPYNEVTNVNSVADHDEVFATYAGHPRIVSVLQQLLAPNAKLFFDNLYNKGPYFEANRFHQDGFFMFSKGAITLWIALDDVTLDNGCFYYIPLTAGYGRFSFDNLGRDDGGITLDQLQLAVPIELKAGDAAVHDRWTIHATGPNETPYRRRGWSVFYTDAESRFVRDPVFNFERYVQTPEGEHWRDDQIYGNRHYRLVCGREFPGCV
jgi:ectoine hydroxylase-related dioxygenase (phytanoyl-CoA dioxygenase family)